MRNPSKNTIKRVAKFENHMGYQRLMYMNVKLRIPQSRKNILESFNTAVSMANHLTQLAMFYSQPKCNFQEGGYYNEDSVGVTLQTKEFIINAKRSN